MMFEIYEQIDGETRSSGPLNKVFESYEIIGSGDNSLSVFGR